MKALKLFLIGVLMFFIPTSIINDVGYPQNIKGKGLEKSPVVVNVPEIQFPFVHSLNASIVTKEEPTKTIPVAPQTTDWESIFNTLKGSLPGNYIVADKGSWGATDLSSGTVYIAPRTPLKYLKSVMLHESLHVRQGYVYGNINAARAALSAFGGLEPVADCGARMLGATWTNYVTSCTDAMNHAARAILSGIPA
jgi:hypothetical protein